MILRFLFILLVFSMPLVPSELAKELLDPIFSEEEKNIIITAISNHSHKERIDDAYSELIKDADCWSHYLEKMVLKHEESERLKLLKIM